MKQKNPSWLRKQSGDKASELCKEIIATTSIVFPSIRRILRGGKKRELIPIITLLSKREEKKVWDQNPTTTWKQHEQLPFL
jgi:hypothetical protein